MNKDKMIKFIDSCIEQARIRLHNQDGIVRNCYNAGYLEALNDIRKALNSKGGIKQC